MKNKALAILLSAVVAFSLWFYVITVVSPESEKTYYNIPVVLQNKNILSERGLMIVSEEPTVTLALKSDRTILNSLNENNINVIINVANIERPGIHNMTYDIAYPGNIPDNAISVQSSSTDLITIQVENRLRKVIPVEIDYGETEVPDGYIADTKNAQFDADIEITGPESVISQIEKAVISVDLTGQTRTVVGQYQYTLCNAGGEPVDAKMVVTDTEKVSYLLKIEQLKDITLKLDVIYGGGATQENTSITMDNTQIQVSGSDGLLDGMDSLTVGTINLSEMLTDEVLTFPIILPEGVTNRTGVEQVSVDVKFQGLATKSFNIKDISAVNIPAGLRVDLITKALQVTVRGPADTVKDMTEADLSVTVDMTEAKAGTATMKADVVISEAFPGVGAVGTYQVSAKLRD